MTVHDLPPIEAALNGIATALITAGYVFIRKGNMRAHRACMLSAAAASALFLAFYVTYHALMRGLHTPFGGPGAIRTLYFLILWTNPACGADCVSRAPHVHPCAEGRIREASRLGAGHVPHLVLCLGDRGLVYFFLYQWWPAVAPRALT